MIADPARDRVYIAWTTSPSDTEAVSYLASSSDGGRTFASPIQIGGRAEFWPVLRVADDGTLFVAWTHWQLDVLLDKKDPYSNAAWTYVAKSIDGGRSLGAPVLVESNRPVAAHYYMSMAVTPDGESVTTSWFDYTPFSIPSLPQPGREAVTMWASTSHDGGMTFGPPVEISADTCVCCMEQGVVMNQHPAFVFRNWHAGDQQGDLRNPAIVSSSDAGDAWLAPITIHDDQFNTPTCPHVGFGAAVDTSGRLHVSWWTGATANPGFFYASSDDGQTFATPTRLAVQVEDPHENDAALGVDLTGTAWATTVDPGLVAADGSSDPAASAVTLWSIDRSGAPARVSGAEVKGHLPQVAGLTDGAILAWVDPSNRLMTWRIGR
jgi:hypothetical protein